MSVRFKNFHLLLPKQMSFFMLIERDDPFTHGISAERERETHGKKVNYAICSLTAQIDFPLTHVYSYIKDERTRGGSSTSSYLSCHTKDLERKNHRVKLSRFVVVVVL